MLYGKCVKTKPWGKLNEDTMASYENQLTKKEEKNLHGNIRVSRCAAGKKSGMSPNKTGLVLKRKEYKK